MLTCYHKIFYKVVAVLEKMKIETDDEERKVFMLNVNMKAITPVEPLFVMK